MWILTGNDMGREIYQDLDKALEAMACAIFKGEDAILKEDTPNYMSWTLEYTQVADKKSPVNRFVWSEVFGKRNNMQLYKSISMSDIMDKRGIEPEPDVEF